MSVYRDPSIAVLEKGSDKGKVGFSFYFDRWNLKVSAKEA